MTDGARLASIAFGGVLVVGITYLRFCGDLSLPPKPAPPARQSQTAVQLLSESTSSPSVYRDFLEHDAAAAGVHVPSIDDMSRKLVDRVDDSRHVLDPGSAPIELAGLRLKLARGADDQIVMQIENLTTADLAYEVITQPSVGASVCTPARPIAFNAMVVHQGTTETRTECAYRGEVSIAVTRVETLELLPLSSWYVSQVPPAQVGIEDRIARGHRAPTTHEKCTGTLAQAVRAGIERGQITWRDLIDFYARHRCQTYQFPSTYRALNADHERPIPVSATGP